MGPDFSRGVGVVPAPRQTRGGTVRVDTKAILLERGERKVVGGQEDMIIEVAVELQRRAAAAQNAG